jgi:hypothetical protein
LGTTVVGGSFSWGAEKVVELGRELERRRVLWWQELAKWMHM